MPVRVRYGPSPTGEPHVGNIRTALFDWLFARHFGGQFVVRIEDTDQKRRVKGAEALILDALRWLGLDWDEGPDKGGPYGPYRQSERLSLYADTAERLLAEGKAYRCACTPERLDAMREAQQARKEPPRYDRHCRELSGAEIERAIREHDGQFVVRFQMPLDGVTVVPDALRGDVRFENALVDDHVLLKADGYPTYHLASVVDDHAMAITHVIRGDEWLSSAPRHVALYAALGYVAPTFIHQPIILGPDRGKLSKRHGATSVRQYAAEGYLPDALLNFLALLGWAKDDHTVIMSRAEMVEAFGVEGMGTTNAMFDIERLREMNGHYIRQLPAAGFADAVLPFLERLLPPEATRPVDRDLLVRVAPMVQERIKLLPEAVEYTDFFFLAEPPAHSNTDLMGKGFRDNPAGARGALEEAARALEGVARWEEASLEEALRGLAERLGQKPGVLFTPIRVAVTGRPVAPPLFGTLAVLGRGASLRRLRAAAARLAPFDD